MQANVGLPQGRAWPETRAVCAVRIWLKHACMHTSNSIKLCRVAGPNTSPPAKTHGASELTGGKTGGFKDLTGGQSSSVSDLTSSKEGDKSYTGDDNKGGLFSGITGSGKETGISGLTGGKTGGVSDLTGQETGGIGGLVNSK